MPFYEYYFVIDLPQFFIILLLLQNIICLAFIFRNRKVLQPSPILTLPFLIATTLYWGNSYLLIVDPFLLPNFNLALTFLLGPLLLLGVRRFFILPNLFLIIYLAHFLPAFASLFLINVAIDTALYWNMAFAATLHFAAYWGWSIGLIQQQQSRVEDQRRLADLRHFVFLLGLGWVTVLAELLLTTYYPRLYRSFIVMGLIGIYLWGRYAVVRAREIYQRYENWQARKIVNPKTEKYKDSALSKEKSRQLATKLKQLMEDQRPYREEGASLHQLSALLGTTPKYLSQIINENFNCNFFDFINGYRIDEAKAKLADPDFKRHKIYEIMYAVGFKSRSSFHTAMKKATGLSPKEYREQHLVE